MKEIVIIGGGLAGSEAAYQIAKRGIKVKLYEMKPIKFTEAHSNKNFAEIVCSNSFKSNLHTNACGLLKEELRYLDSLLIKIADETQVPAGQALAVDREIFAERVTNEIEKNPLIEIIHEEVTNLDELTKDGIVIIATGPVGPEINGKLQPKIPAINDKIIAPHIPAAAPMPDATPKANACGKAIILAMIAPKISPFKVLNLFFIVLMFKFIHSLVIIKSFIY